ncbi:Permease of the drug/metabolite transporter (DMT) superfamily [Bacillus subtilis subsp. subtilis]|nr:Permease of the drug/metabolite transporter (DMT) superfamily [Bacillus subtilis subsp. subtilis]QJD06082.1 Permease of the drug/metabolite transporter (DMT) superfamily [Bacillus subtilis subsp. subtilis]
MPACIFYDKRHFTPIILFSDKSFLHTDNHGKKKNDKMTSASILKGRGR